MFEYCISISRNGKHVFRVELGGNNRPSLSKVEAFAIIDLLRERFPDHEITVFQRSLVSDIIAEYKPHVNNQTTSLADVPHRPSSPVNPLAVVTVRLLGGVDHNTGDRMEVGRATYHTSWSVSDFLATPRVGQDLMMQTFLESNQTLLRTPKLLDEVTACDYGWAANFSVGPFTVTAMAELPADQGKIILGILHGKD